MTADKKPTAGPPKGQRELDQIRQIAYAHGAKISAQTTGAGRHIITITKHGVNPDDQQFLATLYAIESVLRGQFDRGQRFQGMSQFSLKTNLIDVQVRCFA